MCNANIMKQFLLVLLLTTIFSCKREKLSDENIMQIVVNPIEGDIVLSEDKYFSDYIKDKDLDAIPFWEFDSVVTITRGNREISEKISYQSLSDMTPVVYGDESIPYLSFGEVRREAKSPGADKAIFVYDRATAMEFLSVLPSAYMLTAPTTAQVLEKYGLTQKKCEIPNERCKDVFVFQKGYKFSDFERCFIDILSETKNKIEFDLH